MTQEIPTWLGLLSICVAAGLVAFAMFRLRQGAKIKRPQEGSPPERLNW